jgi:hypothetical protein
MERGSQARSFSHPTAGLLLLLFLAPAISGCKGQTNWDATESGRLFFLVSGVSDAVQRPERFQALFVTGSVPANITAYRKYTYQGDREARISGDTATMTVIVRDVKSGKEMAQKEWTAVKEGDTWKLKTAPIP